MRITNIVHRSVTSILTITLLFSISQLSAANLYVFYPSDIRPKALQDKINQRCPNVNTVAFGRVVDFYRQIEHVPPNAIVSLKPVVHRQKSYTESLKGNKNGRYVEEYLLVSINKPVDLKQIENLKIGVLDILGRKPMKRFMNDLFKRKLKIKRVVKTEDFLPLLTFGLADAIFVSKTTFKKLQNKSKQILVPTKIGISIGLAVTGIHPQDNNDIAQCIKGLDNNTNTLLGIDGWESVQ